MADVELSSVRRLPLAGPASAAPAAPGQSFERPLDVLPIHSTDFSEREASLAADAEHRDNQREVFLCATSPDSPGASFARSPSVFSVRSEGSEASAKPDFRFRQVVYDEQDHIRRTRRSRQAQSCCRLPSDVDSQEQCFSLAFSGGGTRAAAFQAGVLWSLAEEGLLKNVDYWVAVSGGAYITSSFLSHLQDERPGPGEDTDSFYLRIVAKTLVRMQKNAGNFIRDPAQKGQHRRGAGAGASERDPSDWPPRFLDIVFFIYFLMATVFLSRVVLLVLMFIPAGECIHLFLAAPMREAWCSQNPWQLPQDTGIHVLEVTTFIASISAFIAFVLSKTSFVLRSPYNKRYLFMRATVALLVRLFLTCLSVLLIIYLVPIVQDMTFGEGSGAALCVPYAQRLHSLNVAMPCADHYYSGATWVQFLPSFNISDPLLKYPPRPRVRQDLLIAFLLVFATALPTGFVLMPLSPRLVTHVVTWFAPVLLLCWTLMFVQWRVYGPITGQRLLGVPFNEEAWHLTLSIAGPIWLALYILSAESRRTWHTFYMRSLRLNFFQGGKDRRFTDQLKQPYCPFVLFTGTVNDYRPPGSEESISEISFSPLHMGGTSTGYVRMPKYETLAKCTALTGAGCLDAITLSLSSGIRYRIWLVLLDLCWGDYVLFLPPERWILPCLKRWCGRRIMKKAEVSRFHAFLFQRIPLSIAFMVVIVLFSFAYFAARTKDVSACPVGRAMMATSALLFCAMVGLSFFAFTRALHWFMFSPFIRQYQQMTRFTYEANEPPGVLYVTEGVQDCTGVAQLLRRRRKRILLAFAAADPEDELRVVRDMMQECTRQRLASFFDPEEPRRNISRLLAKFKEDKEMLYLSIGIFYPPEPESGVAEAVGKLVLVKNRLPPSWTEDDSAYRFTIRPLLTVEEVCTGKSPADVDEDDILFSMRPEDLGGPGCCDCCHRRGLNCGRKFPNLTALNYMLLTPQLFNCLCRLGRSVSLAGMKELLRSEEKESAVVNNGREWQPSLRARFWSS